MKTIARLILLTTTFLAINIPMIAYGKEVKKTKADKKKNTKATVKPVRKTEKTISLDTSSVLLFMEPRKAYQSIGVDETGLVDLKTAPKDEITAYFPSKDYLQYYLQIHSLNNIYNIAFNCDEKSNCTQIALSDVVNGKLKLTFSDSKLEAVGTEILGIALDKKATIKIMVDSPNKKNNAKSPANIYDALNYSGQNEIILFGENDTLKPEYFFKECIFECSDCKTKKDSNYKESIRSIYNQAFLKSPYFKYGGNATTLKYVVVVDARENIADNNKSKVTYLKLKNRKGYESYSVKKHISPLAYNEMQINVLCDKDSSYNIQRDNGRNYFIDGSDQFQNVINQFINSKAILNNIDKNKVGSGTDSLTKNQIKSFSQISPLKTKDDSIVTRKNVILKIDTIDKKNQNPVNAKQVDHAVDFLVKYDFPALADHNNFPASFIEIIDDIQKHPLDYDLPLVGSLLENLFNESSKYDTKSKKRDSLASRVQYAYDAIIAYGWGSYNLEMKKNFLSLSQAIKNFNHQYFILDYNVADWAKDITTLKNAIIQKFGIPVTSNADDLARSMIRLIHDDPKISPVYYADYVDIIKTIQEQYRTINSKKPTMKLIGKQMDVPNVDVFNVSVNEANKEAKNIFSRDFRVSSGFQIDFSTGFFLNGINYNQFSVLPTTMHYHGTGIDSLNVHDTTGKLIYRNPGNITYGTGFLVHAYTRTGHFYDGGLATGIMFDNNANFDLLLGLSLMLHTGPNRISLTGGLCWGKQNDLSPYAKQYKRTSDTSYANRPNVLQSIRNVKFYNNDKAETTTNWIHSWFLAITFNFATIKPGKKNDESL